MKSSKEYQTKTSQTEIGLFPSRNFIFNIFPTFFTLFPGNLIFAKAECFSKTFCFPRIAI